MMSKTEKFLWNNAIPACEEFPRLLIFFFSLFLTVYFLTKISLWLKPNFLFCNFQCSTTGNNRAHLNILQDDKKKRGKADKSGSGEGVGIKSNTNINRHP